MRDHGSYGRSLTGWRACNAALCQRAVGRLAACLAGSFSPAQASSCTPCPTNSFSAANASTCTCSVAYYTTGTGLSLTCTGETGYPGWPASSESSTNAAPLVRRPQRGACENVQCAPPTPTAPSLACRPAPPAPPEAPAPRVRPRAPAVLATPRLAAAPRSSAPVRLPRFSRRWPVCSAAHNRLYRCGPVGFGRFQRARPEATAVLGRRAQVRAALLGQWSHRTRSAGRRTDVNAGCKAALRRGVASATD